MNLSSKKMTVVSGILALLVMGLLLLPLALLWTAATEIGADMVGEILAWSAQDVDGGCMYRHQVTYETPLGYIWIPVESLVTHVSDGNGTNRAIISPECQVPAQGYLLPMEQERTRFGFIFWKIKFMVIEFDPDHQPVGYYQGASMSFCPPGPWAYYCSNWIRVGLMEQAEWVSTGQWNW